MVARDVTMPKLPLSAIALLAVLIFWMPVRAQVPSGPARPQPVAQEEPPVGAQAPVAVEQEQSVNLNELPTRLERSVQIVRRVTRGLGPELDDLAGQLPEVAAGLRVLLEQSRQSVRNDRAPSLIAYLRALWREADRKLGVWQTRLLSVSETLEKDRAVLAEELEYLTAAQAQLATEGVQPDTLATIERVQAQVATAEALAQNYRNRLLSLQAQLAELTIEIQLAEEELAETAASERGQMLRLDAPPIWRRAPGVARVPETAAAVAGRAATEAEAGGLTTPERAALAYVAGYVLLAVFQFIAGYLVFLVPLLLLRRRAPAWAAADRPAIRGLGRAVERPWSAAILPAILATALWRGHVQLNSSLLLFPLLRVVPRLLPKSYSPGLWGLAALFVVDRLAGAVLPELATGRRLLELALIAGTAFGLFWLDRQLGANGRTAGMFRAARVGLRLGVGALGVAFVSEIVGASIFARYLESGILATMYGAVLLYGFLLMFRGFLDLLIQSSPAQLESLIQHAPAGLPQRLNAGMRWVTLVLFLLLVVETFQFADPLLAFGAAVMAESLSIGEIEFTVGSLFIIVATLAVVVALSSVLRFFLTAAVYDRVRLQRGTGEVINKLLHYALLTAGFLFALGAAGIDLNNITIIMGAVGVGIGLGLQNIVGNFVSGLILLFERPLSVGDIVSVNNIAGVVADIGIRATRIRTWDGADVAVPNSNLISGEFTNWSLSDEKRRADVKVGVAYGTDPEQVCRLLKEVATSHPLVLKDVEPVALFTGFGDSSLDFVLRYWTNLADTFAVNSDMHTAVYQRLAADGIEIPFPQRDVHLKEVESAAPEPSERRLTPLEEA